MNNIYVKQILNEDPIYQPMCTGYQTPLLQVQIVWKPTGISMTISQVSRLDYMDLFGGGLPSASWHLTHI